jgi:trimethylamine:corrinoid methyltransferase-like protein
LIYRDSRDAWTTGGGKTFEQRANEIARTILKEHEPLPLPEDVSQALDKLVSDAMKSLIK